MDTHAKKLIGHARVSTEEQEVQLQVDALIEAGCKKKNIFIDRVSGARVTRPGLDQCLAVLETGDTLIV